MSLFDENEIIEKTNKFKSKIDDKENLSKEFDELADKILNNSKNINVNKYKEQLDDINKLFKSVDTSIYELTIERLNRSTNEVLNINWNDVREQLSKLDNIYKSIDNCKTEEEVKRILENYSSKSILMCKNKKVYNIDTEEVYNEELLPGYMQRQPCKETFKSWLKLRYSSNTNSVARQLSGVTFGQGNRVSINESTYALSLSDCYWIKRDNDNIRFEEVSPYCVDFWKGEGYYSKGAIPTLYVGGFLSKEWIDSNTLNKYGEQTYIEEECSRLCQLCDIPVAKVKRIENGVSVENITNVSYMLEQANMSGLLDPDDFYDLDILQLFEHSGLQMLIIDAIVGNGDRHAGNFGWLRSADTGNYLGMSPLYDFDHALDSKSETDRMIEDIVRICKISEYRVEAERISNIVVDNTINDIFRMRAKSLLSMINKFN